MYIVIENLEMITMNLVNFKETDQKKILKNQQKLVLTS